MVAASRSNTARKFSSNSKTKYLSWHATSTIVLASSQDQDSKDGVLGCVYWKNVQSTKVQDSRHVADHYFYFFSFSFFYVSIFGCSNHLYRYSSRLKTLNHTKENLFVTSAIQWIPLDRLSKLPNHGSNMSGILILQNTLIPKANSYKYLQSTRYAR